MIHRDVARRSQAISDPRARDWFERRTYEATSSTPEELAARKHAAGITVSVCLPALDEAATIGPICRSIHRELMEGCALVDELIVIDSGSVDRTAPLARRHGAEVYPVGDILGSLAPADGGGKGDALWRSLAVATGDVVVWLDSDTRNFTTRFVTGLVAPLIDDDLLVMTKGFYRRPLGPAPELDGAAQGGRVTELVVRPLLQTLCPELAGVVQPLSGEYAGRRAALSRLSFFTGYGVDIGLLLDVAHEHGVMALAQVDLGVRAHRNRDLAALGRMSYEIMGTLFRRLEERGRLALPPQLAHEMIQFSLEADELRAVAFSLPLIERPPMASYL